MGYLLFGDPKGTRTPVTGVRGQCPRPLDDGACEGAGLLKNPESFVKRVICSPRFSLLSRAVAQLHSQLNRLLQLVVFPGHRPFPIHTLHQQLASIDKIQRVESVTDRQAGAIEDLAAGSGGNTDKITVQEVPFGLDLTKEIFLAPQGLAAVNEGLGLGGDAVEVDRRADDNPVRALHPLVQGGHVVLDDALPPGLAIAAAGAGMDRQFREVEPFGGKAPARYPLFNPLQQELGVAVLARTAVEDQDVHDSMAPWVGAGDAGRTGGSGRVARPRSRR